MDFALDAKGEAFRAEVRQFIAENVTAGMVHRAWATGTLHDWDLWRALGRRRWIAPDWPAADGGEGRDIFEVAAMREEFGLADAPVDGWYTTLLVANTIRSVGSERMKTDILPRVLAGDVVACLGFSEPENGSDAAAARLRAERDGDEWVLNGQKIFTTLAQVATHVFILARSNPAAPKHHGLTTFLVPMDAPGITIQPIATLGGEVTNVTFYSDVRIPDSARVGEADGGWGVMRVAFTFERLGGGGGSLRRLRGIADSYVRSAADDSGRPLIADPSVRERLTSIAMDAEIAHLFGSRSFANFAAGTLSHVHTSTSKLFSSEAFQRATRDALDILGEAATLQSGFGQVPAGGEIEHQWRHAQVATIYGGSSEVQREILAGQRLGLPRGR